MKDFLLQHDGRYIECEIDDLTIIYTGSDDPKSHYERRLRTRDSYSKLKDRVEEIYKSYDDTSEAYWDVFNYLHSCDADEFFTDDVGMLHQDLRDIDEIVAYAHEACDKVWLMRSRPCDIPDIEAGRLASIDRVLRTYDDIPENGYTDWECGYWNGIMGALRWVMGDEKDTLDT